MNKKLFLPTKEIITDNLSDWSFLLYISFTYCLLSFHFLNIFNSNTFPPPTVIRGEYFLIINGSFIDIFDFWFGMNYSIS